jgi:hypothetical protein
MDRATYQRLKRREQLLYEFGVIGRCLTAKSVAEAEARWSYVEAVKRLPKEKVLGPDIKWLRAKYGYIEVGPWAESGRYHEFLPTGTDEASAIVLDETDQSALLERAKAIAKNLRYRDKAIGKDLDDKIQNLTGLYDPDGAAARLRKVIPLECYAAILAGPDLFLRWMEQIAPKAADEWRRDMILDGEDVAAVLMITELMKNLTTALAREPKCAVPRWRKFSFEPHEYPSLRAAAAQLVLASSRLGYISEVCAAVRHLEQEGDTQLQASLVCPMRFKQIAFPTAWDMYYIGLYLALPYLLAAERCVKMLLLFSGALAQGKPTAEGYHNSLEERCVRILTALIVEVDNISGARLGEHIRELKALLARGSKDAFDAQFFSLTSYKLLCPPNLLKELLSKSGT